MIHLPIEAIIKSIESPCICHFKDINHPKDSPCHFYVVIPVNNTSDLILCIITSKKEKRKAYYNRIKPKASESLVKINRQDFPFLNRDSIVDCNRAELISKNIFKKRIDSNHNLKIKVRNIEPSVLKKIKTAIKNSPLVASYIKELI